MLISMIQSHTILSIKISLCTPYKGLNLIQIIFLEEEQRLTNTEEM